MDDPYTDMKSYRAGGKFYNDIDPWFNMSDKEREKYRIGGGCERLG